MEPHSGKKRVAVVGAGIIGLSAAWEASRRGHRVTLIDPRPASGATYAAAGMLAPASEFHFQEEGLLALTRESAALYPDFLASVPGWVTNPNENPYQASGTLVVGVDSADRAALGDLYRQQRDLGLDVEEMTTGQARRREPMLGTTLSGAFLAPSDHSVDPRSLAEHLLQALRGAGSVIECAATALDGGDDGVHGVHLADGSTVEADEVILANGVAAATMLGLPAAANFQLRPVYGDILRLRVPPALRPLLNGTVRGLVRGMAVYLVPRVDGSLVIGATQREDGNAGVSAGGVHQLLRDAQQLVPAVAELEFIEATCRARPGSLDNAPLLGRIPGAGSNVVPGLIIATGFFRHGVLLAPLAARVCADLLDGQEHPVYRRYAPGPHRYQGAAL